MKYLDKVTHFLRLLARPYPLRDWYIIISIAIVVFVILVSVSVHFFFGIRSGSIAGPIDSDQSPTPNVSREKLEEVVSDYELRRTNYEAGNINTPSSPDPS